jgi:prophage regulatory protein
VDNHSNLVGPKAPRVRLSPQDFQTKKQAALKAESAEPPHPKPEVETTAPLDRLLTKREVCRVAHTSFPTLWQWMRQGKFPPPKVVGGRSMWRASSVESWLNNLPVRKYKPTPEQGGSDAA